MKKVFIVTGELSGDIHASYVVRELKKLDPEIQIEAIGGVNLADEGVKLFCDNRKMGVMGFALGAIIHHYKLGKNLVKYLKNEYKPDLVLLIDYGGFNLRLGKALKKEGIKNIFYYISPQVWASRKHRINTIREFVSKMLVIFPFEENLYKKYGVNVEFVGHPLMSQLPDVCNKEELVKKYGLNPDKRIVGIFPGSRKMEIDYMLPIFLKAAKLIASKAKDVQFCLGQAPNLKDDLLNKYLKMYDNDKNIQVIKNANYDLLANSDATILTSGTITLEATLFKTPMVVSYKGPDFLYPLYLLVRYLKYVSLPNVITNRELVKEYLQYKAKPDLIADEILGLLNNTGKRGLMISELSQIGSVLGSKTASKEVARNIYECINEQ